MLTPEQEKELLEKVGKEATEKAKTAIAEAEKKINEASQKATEGLMTKADFESFKKDELQKVNEKLESVSKLEDVMKEQGNKINKLLEKGEPASKTLEQFITELAPTIKELRTSGKFVEFSASQLKAAGLTSISNTVQAQTNAPTSPYLPGLGGPELELFDIVRNPNYIITQVDLGRTNQSRLAWINETGEDGTPVEIAEGETKPKLSNTFQVEMSTAKKVPGYYELTEEFEDDLPQLSTRIRRMLEERVIRGWDDVLQQAVQDVATAYSLPAVNNQIPFANYWDAIYAMMTQVWTNNFSPNTVGINPQTNLLMQGDKTSVGDYLVPPFKEEIQRMLVKANKVPAFNAFVGDLKQFKVDIYKEFALKIGWINDNFIQNKFVILGEIRYHRYISDNRKPAIVKGNLGNIRALLDGGSGS